MADVEDHAALFGFAHFGEQFALLIDNRRLLRRVTMCDHIAATKRIGNLAHRDNGIAHMNHHRRFRRFAGANRQTQCLPSVLSHTFLCKRTLIPTPTSGDSPTVAAAAFGSANLRSSSSPGSFNTPCCARAIKAIMRVLDGS